MRLTHLLRAAAVVALATGFATGMPPAAASPIDQACVRPDGTPCPAMPPGCVHENGMPCSGSLADINAACNQNPVVCRWLTG